MLVDADQAKELVYRTMSRRDTNSPNQKLAWTRRTLEGRYWSKSRHGKQPQACKKQEDRGEITGVTGKGMEG